MPVKLIKFHQIHVDHINVLKIQNTNFFFLNVKVAVLDSWNVHNSGQNYKTLLYYYLIEMLK